MMWFRLPHTAPSPMLDRSAGEMRHGANVAVCGRVDEHAGTFSTRAPSQAAWD